MDAFRRRAALYVADVALERDQVPVPGCGEVGTREGPGVRHKAQGRAMRGAPVVVGEVLPRGGRSERVAQALEDPPQLVLREKIEEENGVSLLGHLVAIRLIARGFQDPIQSLDVAVPLPV